MLRTYLESFGLLQPNDIEDFLARCQRLTLQKSEYFIQIGQVEKRVGFLEDGILRSFYYSEKAEEITYCMLFPNTLVSGYSSFLTGRASEESIQAITPVELWTITKDDLYTLVDGNIRWINFMRIIAERLYIEQESRIFQLQKFSAIDRYTRLLKEQPEYALHIPLRYLASYLGITQRHLSRIRNQLAK